MAAPFEWAGEQIGRAAGMLVELVWKVFDTTTRVDVTNPEYIGVYNIMFGIAIGIMLTFFFLQLITGLVRRDPTALRRAATGLATSILGSFVLIAITAGLLELTDQVSRGIVHASGTTMAEMGGRIAAMAASLGALNVAAPGVGAILSIVFGLLLLAAAALVWFTLLTRKALLLLAIVFGPIALSGRSWDAARGWFARWAGFVLALIASKIVMTVVFLVAVAQLNSPIESDLASLADPVAGIVLMFVAAFSPYMAYKLIAFAGADTYQLATSEQDAKQALNRSVPLPGSGGGAGPRRPETVLGSTTSDTPTSAPPTTPASAASAGGSAAGGATVAGAGAAGSAAVGTASMAGQAAAQQADAAQVPTAGSGAASGPDTPSRQAGTVPSSASEAGADAEPSGGANTPMAGQPSEASSPASDAPGGQQARAPASQQPPGADASAVGGGPPPAVTPPPVPPASPEPRQNGADR